MTQPCVRKSGQLDTRLMRKILREGSHDLCEFDRGRLTPWIFKVQLSAKRSRFNGYIPGTIRAGGFGTQQQGGASRLRQTCPDENSVAGGIRTTGSVKAARVHFLKASVQPILILGR